MRGRKAAKYRNIKSNGFDSRKEEKQFYGLQIMEQLGKIKQLQRQIKIEIIPSFRFGGHTYRGIYYVADFTYYDEDGNYVVEDVKSEFTRKLPVYRMKKKLLMYLKGIEIREV